MRLPSIAQVRKAKEYIMPPEEVSYASDPREAIDVVFSSNISTLEKVYALDKIYGCNLKLRENDYGNDYRDLSKRLKEKDKDIKNASDETADAIVSEIAKWEYKVHKQKGEVSRRIRATFASKYCYFTKPEPEGTFIIYDKYADVALTYLEDKRKSVKPQYWDNYDKYASKVRDELLKPLKAKYRDYVCYRDLDKYLWYFGQVLSGIENPKDVPSRVNGLAKTELEKRKLALDPT